MLQELQLCDGGLRDLHQLAAVQLHPAADVPTCRDCGL
jgi:hypothetical protein